MDLYGCSARIRQWLFMYTISWLIELQKMFSNKPLSRINDRKLNSLYIGFVSDLKVSNKGKLLRILKCWFFSRVISLSLALFLMFQLWQTAGPSDGTSTGSRCVRYTVWLTTHTAILWLRHISQTLGYKNWHMVRPLQLSPVR